MKRPRHLESLIAFATAAGTGVAVTAVLLLAAGCASPDSGPLVPYPPQTQSPAPQNPGGGAMQAGEMNDVLDAIAAKSGQPGVPPAQPTGTPGATAPAGTTPTSPNAGANSNPSASSSGSANASRGATSAGAQATRARPLGRDDDILARQLREAAERETDPSVRAKLWKEYNDYKSSSP